MTPTMTDAKFLLLCVLLYAASVHAADEEDSQDPVMKKTMPAYALALGANLLNSTQCRSDLNDFRVAVDHRTLWSMKMLDSSGEPKPGFIYGNNYWLGSRSQCDDASNRVPFVLADKERLNNTKYRDPDTEFPPFELNYFVAHFRHNSTMQYHVRLPNEDLVTLGLCLPASCTTSEIDLILRRMFRERTLLVGDLYSVDFKLVEVRDLQDDHQWLVNGKLIFIGCILVLTWTLMLVGTAYDVFVHRKYLKAKKKLLAYENNNTTMSLHDTEAETLSELQQSSIGKILLCFSIYTNTRIIFDTKLAGDSVSDIHGLRFVGMVWIVMIHTIFYMNDYSDNKAWSWRMAEGFAVQVISNSTLSVDTFFFLSGFLLAYGYLKGKIGKVERRPINWSAKAAEFFLTVLKRFIRLTPAYMMVIGIAELNFGWYHKTSQFYMSERPDDVCAKYWWRNILYINNLFGRESMCLSWSWYLSNDMQFFIIGTLLLMLSSIYFLAAVAILGGLLIFSTILTGYMSYIYEYVPTLDEQYNLLEVLYDPPWIRIGPYLVGMATAYIVIKLNNKLQLVKRTVALCWCVGSLCNLLVLFGLWEKHISILSAAFYVALGRTVWAIGIAWIIIACRTQHGGVVHQLLSFRGWIPLSRLTYCVYLLNPLLINSVYLYSETSVHVDFLPNCMMFMGNLVCCYFCAYALSLMVETPYILLVRQLLNSRTRRK